MSMQLREHIYQMALIQVGSCGQECRLTQLVPVARSKALIQWPEGSRPTSALQNIPERVEAGRGNE